MPTWTNRERWQPQGRDYWLAVKAARVSAGIFAERMTANLHREQGERFVYHTADVNGFAGVVRSNFAYGYRYLTGPADMRSTRAGQTFAYLTSTHQARDEITFDQAAARWPFHLG